MSRSRDPAPPTPPEPERRRDEPGDEQTEILALVEPLRRFALSRVHDAHDAEDITQETLTRVLAARGRLEDGTLTGYAFAVARNLVAGRYREADLGRRHSARLVDRREPPQPEHVLLAAEDRRALATALRELPQRQRDQLVEHVVHDVAVSELGGESGAAAVAAQLAPDPREGAPGLPARPARTSSCRHRGAGRCCSPCRAGDRRAGRPPPALAATSTTSTTPAPTASAPSSRRSRC